MKYNEFMLNEKSQFRLISKLIEEVKYIHWQGGRNPNHSQFKKNPIIIFTINYLSKNIH